jgi:hypothetical protein
LEIVCGSLIPSIVAPEDSAKLSIEHSGIEVE